MRNKQCKHKPFLFWLISIIAFLMTFIVVYATFVQQPPNKAMGLFFGKLKGDSIYLPPPTDSLLRKIDNDNKIIDSLTTELNSYRQAGVYKKGTIHVESGTLNMRDKPSLHSDIVAKIPDKSSVEIIYFDTQVYYLEGKQGRWVRIKYADQYGWVWNGYVTLQE